MQCPRQHRHRRLPAGFTLVELLVVIGIIALLISILLPSLNRARAAAREVQCLSNMRQVGLGMLNYAHNYKGTLPLISEDWFILPYVNTPTHWGTLLLDGKYIATDDVFYCPDHELIVRNHPTVTDQEYATFWGLFSYGMNLACSHSWSPVAYQAMKLTDVRTSADKILLVEVCLSEANSNEGYPFAYPWYGGNEGTAWPRHGRLEKANVLWFDGHTSSVRSENPGVHSGIYGPGALTQMNVSLPPDTNRWRIK